MVLLVSIFSSLFGCRGGKGARPDAPARLQWLGIYYGWPSGAGGARSVEEAAARLGSFEVLVLGGGLERPQHGDHERTRAILTRLEGVEVFGYIPLGQATGLDEKAIAASILAWKAMGVRGIFFDEAGYDFGNTRARQRAAFAAAHREGLKVFANAFQPDDLFADGRDAQHNPRGEKAGLAAGDAYLYESFGVRLGEPEPEEEREAKLGRLAPARKLGVRLYGITTATSAEPPPRPLWDGVVAAARRAGLTGIGWGTREFGAQDGRLPAPDLRP